MLASLFALLAALTPADTVALTKLRDGIAGANDVAELKQRLAASPLVRTVEQRAGSDSYYGKRTWPVIEVTLRKPIPARAFTAAMKWKRPYIVSTDVHQNSWHIVIWDRDLESPYGPRVAAVEPAVGNWVFTRVHVDGRPDGELPGVRWGASPAYPTDKYTADVVRFTIEAFDRERHRVGSK